MQNTSQLHNFTTAKNVIFYKPGCPFSACALGLLIKLEKMEVISGLRVVYLDLEFTNQQLKELVSEHGWTPKDSEFPAKPQIFINARGYTEYIDGNSALHKSVWNVGEKNGKIKVGEDWKETPNWPNPMDKLRRIEG